MTLLINYCLKFSSRVVETRISKATDRNSAQKPTLVRAIGRIPISKAGLDDERNEDDEENEDDDEPEDDVDARDGSKRLRSESPDPTESLHESKVPKHATGLRAKASDFDDLTKECLVVAIAVYRCLISTTNPFPDHSAESGLGREAWVIACEDLDCDLPLTPRVSKLVSLRSSSLAHALLICQ